MRQTIVLLVSIAILAACGPKNQQAEGNAAGEVYVITASDTTLTDTRWKLIEISAVPVAPPAEKGKELFVILQKEGKIVNGFAGCNSFSGTYELIGGEGIKFSQMTSTLMACKDMEMEKQFTSMFANVTSYDVNIDTLSFHQTPPTPIARFVVMNQ
jgi:heat shock protein HslJ